MNTRDMRCEGCGARFPEGTADDSAVLNCPACKGGPLVCDCDSCRSSANLPPIDYAAEENERRAEQAALRRRKVKIAPHVLDGGKWTASEGAPAIDVRPAPVGTLDGAPRVLTVPLGADERSRAVRAHEYFHRAFESRPCPPDIRHPIMNAVEDARVNTLGYRAGVQDVQKIGSLSEEDGRALGRKLGESGDWQTAALAIVAGTADRSGRDIRSGWESACADERACNRAVTLAEQTVAKLGLLPTVEKSEAAARWLQDALDLAAEQERQRTEAYEKVQGTPAEAEFQAADEAAGQFEESAEHEITYEKPADWGDMALVPWPLPGRHKSRAKVARKYRAAERGTRIGKLRRITTDKHVFEIRRKTPGGTILIDGSGSMGISAAALARILDVAPAATIAVYAGDGNRPGETQGRNRGGLAVMARQGRTIDPDSIQNLRYALGGENIIDGPAVDWLAAQPGPRIWVSDGLVTARGACTPKPDCLRALARTVRAKRIQRVQRLRPVEVAEALARGYRAIGLDVLSEAVLTAAGLRNGGR